MSLPSDRHDSVKKQYDEIHDQAEDSLFAEGMARMAVYHRYCQDPLIFRTLGNIRGKSLLDLACGEGSYTRRFRAECGADPVMGIDLSPASIEKAIALERRDPLGIEYRAADVMNLELEAQFDVVTAIHLLHYLESEDELTSALTKIFDLLHSGGHFITMIANPEFDIDLHDPSDSKTKFGYYFSSAEPTNGGLLRFHPGGFEKERELTFELRRWEREFLNGIAVSAGFYPEWHDPFISEEGLNEFGAEYFENFLANPQSKLLRLSKVV